MKERGGAAAGSWSGAASAVLAVLALLAIHRELPRIAPSGVLWDYGSFLASARAGLEGLDPYGVHPLTMHVSLPGFDGWNPNLNPPISVLLFRAFDLFEPATGMRLWQAVSLVLWAAAVMSLLLQYGRDRSRAEIAATALWCFGLAGVWDTLFLGQIYMPVALAVVGGWLLLERGSGVAAGLLIGAAAAIKPNLLVWPVLLFLAGHRRAALSAGLSFAALSALPLLVFGSGLYVRWFELLAGDGARAAFLTNASLSGLLSRAGAGAAAPAVSAILLAAGALHAFRHRPDAMRTSEIGLLLSLLASPLAWVHYTLFLVPIFVRRWSASDFVPAALLLVPVPFVIGLLDAPPLLGLGFGSVYNWALLLFGVLILADARRYRESPQGRAAEAAQ